MIARLWFGSTRSEDSEAYVAYLEQTGVAAHRATPGNRGSLVLRRERDGVAEFLVLSLWESREAVDRFAGEGAPAVYFPEDDRYLVERRDEIDHYEIVAGEALTIRGDSE